MTNTEHPIASCPIDIPEKENRQLSLFNGKFLVLLNGKAHHYETSQVKSVLLKEKVMLFPAVFGGIASPLALIAAFNGVGNPWLLLIIAFAGLLGLYFGFAGQKAIIVEGHSGSDHYFVFNPHPFLNSYLNLLNAYLADQELSNYFYLSLTGKEFEMLEMDKKLDFTKGRKLIIQSLSDLDTDNKIIVPLSNPYENKLNIRYQFDENDEICSYLYGELSSDAVDFKI